MDEDLPSPVNDYNPVGHTTNALKTSLPTLYIYILKPDWHSCDTCQLYVQVPRITICFNPQKNVECGQGGTSFYFGLTLTEEI
jgi:hypothetical protein